MELGLGPGPKGPGGPCKAHCRARGRAESVFPNGGTVSVETDAAAAVDLAAVALRPQCDTSESAFSDGPCASALSKSRTAKPPKEGSVGGERLPRSVSVQQSRRAAMAGVSCAQCPVGQAGIAVEACAGV